MARLGFPASRSGGQRWRMLVATGLIVAAAGAVLPGGYTAHAAGAACSIPAPISSGISATVGPVGSTTNVPVPASSFTAGTLTVGGLAGGGNLSFSGTGPNAGLAQGTFTTPACIGLYDYFDGSNGTLLLSSLTLGGSLTATLPTNSALGSASGQSVTCNALDIQEVTLTVGSTGDSANVTCKIQNTVLDFTINLGLGGNGVNNTPTPELGSGELFATGIVPILGIAFLRRRRKAKQ